MPCVPAKPLIGYSAHWAGLKPIFMKLWSLFSLLLAVPLVLQSPVYTKAEIMGKLDPSVHEAFVEIAGKYSNRGGMYLREEVYEAFIRMWNAAMKEGYRMEIISATRTQDRQREIWENKWNRFGGDHLSRAKRILQYSSMPGTSRHHWGTDFDINALNNEYFVSGEGKGLYKWLLKNAGKYGFFQPYTGYSKYRDAGYREEKWHWSYYPLSQRFQRAYNHVVSYDDIRNFKGSELAGELNVINDYVNGIEVPENVKKLR